MTDQAQAPDGSTASPTFAAGPVMGGAWAPALETPLAAMLGRDRGEETINFNAARCTDRQWYDFCQAAIVRGYYRLRVNPLIPGRQPTFSMVPNLDAIGEWLGWVTGPRVPLAFEPVDPDMETATVLAPQATAKEREIARLAQFKPNLSVNSMRDCIVRMDAEPRFAAFDSHNPDYAAANRAIAIEKRRLLFEQYPDLGMEVG